MIAKAREAMKTQQLHQVLAIVWAVVAGPTATSPARPPGRSPKAIRASSDRAHVTAEVIRQVSILAQPFMPSSAGKLLDLLAIPAGELQFASLAGTAGSPLAALPAPSPVFPAMTVKQAHRPDADR
jgi:methionyl-tRNA synthetase